MSSEFIRQKTFARGSLTPTERSRLAERDISSPADAPLSAKTPVPPLAAGVLSFQPEAWSRRSIWIVAINEDRPGRGWGPLAISPCDRGGPPKGDTLPLCSEGDGASCGGGAPGPAAARLLRLRGGGRARTPPWLHHTMVFYTVITPDRASAARAPL